MRALSLVVIATLLLAGCGKPATISPTTQDPAVKADGKPGDPSSAGAAPAVAAPMLAYAYTEAIEAPSARLAPLMERHRALCQAAGPARCQVTAAEFSTADGIAAGMLTLRAAPDWLAQFRSGLDQDARGAGGGVIRSEVATEDLTHEIIDTDAALKAKGALRDRLEALIASRPGKLADLLDTEKELARVQGEIDAAQSTLAVMRERVQTSTLTVQYQAQGEGDSGGAKLRRAVRGAWTLSLETVAAMVTVLSILAPVALLGGGVAAIVFWVRRRAFKKKVAADV
jgi:hypothetical protein